MKGAARAAGRLVSSGDALEIQFRCWFLGQSGAKVSLDRWERLCFCSCPGTQVSGHQESQGPELHSGPRWEPAGGCPEAALLKNVLAQPHRGGPAEAWPLQGRSSQSRHTTERGRHRLRAE